MVDLFIDLVALFTSLFLKYIDIFFFPFSVSVSVYVYVSLHDFVCITLLLPFALGFCLSVFLVFLLFTFFIFNNFFYFLF